MLKGKLWQVASAHSREELEQRLNELDAKGCDITFVFSEGNQEGFDFTVVAKRRGESQRGVRRVW